MQIGEIVYGKDGSSVLLLDRKEGQLLIEILEDYCKQNPRKRLARAFRDKIDKNLPCFS